MPLSERVGASVKTALGAVNDLHKKSHDKIAKANEARVASEAVMDHLSSSSQFTVDDLGKLRGKFMLKLQQASDRDKAAVGAGDAASGKCCGLGNVAGASLLRHYSTTRGGSNHRYEVRASRRREHQLRVQCMASEYRGARARPQRSCRFS